MTKPRRKAYCCYCRRPLAATTSRDGRAFTFDHVRPASLGGRYRVPCCRTCNQLKADLPADMWFWFINANPRWWETFSRHEQVRRAVEAEVRRRLAALQGRQGHVVIDEYFERGRG